VILTMIISLLSIVWLVFKSKNEMALFDSRKKDEEGK